LLHFMSAPFAVLLHFMSAPFAVLLHFMSAVTFHVSTICSVVTFPGQHIYDNAEEPLASDGVQIPNKFRPRHCVLLSDLSAR
jgi:hypothetical protein